MKYIDTHAHITSDFYSGENVSDIIELASNAGVDAFLIPGTSKENCLEAIELSKKHDCIFAGVGIHPAHVDENDNSFLRDIDYSNIKFIGETGIDLHYDDNPSLGNQVKSFIEHIELGIKHDLPIEVHVRDAYDEAYDVMKKFPKAKYILHSFSGSLEWAEKFIDLGAFISFSGIVTFKNAKEMQSVAKTIPLGRILCETDSPFLTPVPNRGKKNTPANVKHVVDYIASIRAEENVEQTIYDTTRKVFNI